MSKTEESGTTHGLDYAVVATSMGHRCGYVRVPVGHPLHGLSYGDKAPGVCRADLDDEPIGKRGAIPLMCAALDGEDERAVALDILFNVHGSLTFGGSRSDGEGDWWLGFDCGHAGDRADPELLTSESYRSIYLGGVVRTLDYVRSECEILAKQIVERYPLAPEEQEAAQ